MSSLDAESESDSSWNSSMGSPMPFITAEVVGQYGNCYKGKESPLEE